MVTMMYKSVVQAVLLYGSEIWVVMDAMMTVLEGSHDRIYRQILGVIVRKGDDG